MVHRGLVAAGLALAQIGCGEDGAGIGISNAIALAESRAPAEILSGSGEIPHQNKVMVREDFDFPQPSAIASNPVLIEIYFLT